MFTSYQMCRVQLYVIIAAHSRLGRLGGQRTVQSPNTWLRCAVHLGLGQLHSPWRLGKADVSEGDPNAGLELECKSYAGISVLVS